MTSRSRLTRLATAAGALALAATSVLATTACAPSRDAASTAQADPCAAVRAAAGLPEGASAPLAGHSATIATTFTGTEAERFDASLAELGRCTGVEVHQQGSSSMEEDLRSLAGGTAPQGWDADLAVVPQPGLVGDLAAAGVIAPLPEPVAGNVELGWDSAWSEPGTVGGTLYAAPLQASVKSYVWYDAEAFDKAGYAVPHSWQDLVDLTAQITRDRRSATGSSQGPAAWCLPVQDGQSTGWVLTDWLEDTVLATGGPRLYDGWSHHDTPLDAPDVVTTLETTGALLGEEALLGGRAGSATMTLQDAGTHLAAGDCLMVHASSSFEVMVPAATGATQATTETATDAAGAATEAASQGPAASATDAAAAAVGLSVFTFPRGREDDPLIVAGDYVVSLAHPTTDPATRDAVATYLSSPDWAARRTALGGIATANRTVDAATAPSAVTREATELLQSRSATIRFDASDEMPSEVGTDVLWSALLTWFEGSGTAADALGAAEAAWPASH